MRSSIIDSITRKVKSAGQTLGLAEETRISKLFGKNVFDRPAMKEYLSQEAYQSVVNAIEKGTNVSHEVAEQVALGLKNWAMDRGATHYTHWFQPLTGQVAEKHDSFLTSGNNTQAIERFSVESLIQQEPDASSFTSGGLRNTFEARGYTAWDPSSPAFLMETGKSRTLCIPSIFISYTGEALDFKTPLLKSLDRVDKAATAVAQYFDPRVQRVTATLGWEQEYFIIDEKFYNNRPDLVMTGRTLFGLPAARGQQLEDHYFGSIPERVLDFMVDFETECYKLGIPVKTRHNEVAPSQFECAPHFEDVNTAVDHNQLLMDVLDRVARRNGLRALLHEKPFAGINGSGKHNNWSLATDTGVNLLSPGKDPMGNLQFLTFFINTIHAVYQHADLLLASITSAGNEYRLGANEAPPAIISVFTGQQIQEVLEAFMAQGLEADSSKANKSKMPMDMPAVPSLERDNTDRNRTSPFPFTGNKFEFRACGSSANTSEPMIVLNTIVAHQLQQFRVAVDQRIAQGEAKEAALIAELRRTYEASKAIIFNGDNYSEEWLQIAQSRGLKTIRNAAEAQEAYISPKSVAVFGATKVLAESELHARAEIKLDHYIKKVEIESLLAEELANTHIVASAQRYQKQLADTYRGLKEMGLSTEADELKEQAREISSHISAIRKLIAEMRAVRAQANAEPDTFKQAHTFAEQVKPLYDRIRQHADQLENLVDDSLWQLPKYREILFIR
ncbi:MAG: glutamine synthetase III [Bacteroidetes bacterium]|jgi:glutamine synthetase|nr:glutamine synthetase III [Bacteroidota bacterium]